jgi:peptide/nickel transport system substrate-binding protein
MERATWARRVILVAAAAAAAAVIGGIISSRATAASPTPATSASAGAGKVVLKIGEQEPLDSLNPFMGWADIAYEVYANQYLLLCGRDTKTLKPNDKGVAKSWEVSPDGLTWTFTINQGITWQDGVPLTAEDVAFTFNYIIDNDMSAYMAYLKYVKRAVLVDPYTVQIICSKPRANLTELWIPILPKHIWSKISPQDAASKFQNSPPVIGDGPWQVVEWKRNRYVRMVANKDFWLGPPKIDEVQFITYQNADSMVEDLKAGNIDAAYLFPEAQYESLKNTPGVNVIKYTWFNWDYLAFNSYTGKSLGNPVLRDQRFRSALEYAINRDQIVNVAYYGYATPGYTFMPPNSWHDPDYSWQPPDGVRRDFDPAKARQLLDAAGYKMGPNGVRLDKQGNPIVLRLWATASNIQGQREAKLIAGWFRDVGIKLKLAVYDSGVYDDRIWNYEGDTFVPDFDMYIWTWDGFLDPGQTLDCFTTSQIENWNDPAWSNKEFDRLDELQSSTLDPNQRAEVIKQMQEVMYQDCPVIVMTYPYKLAAYRTDRWQGWQRENYGTGAAFCGASGPWAYYNIEPKTATAASGGTSSTWIVIIAAIAVAAAVAAFVLVRRGRRAGAEEE